jgi:imidazolonepropionase-like amidohydrolase
MLDRGAWLVPTLVAPRGVLAAAEAGMAIPDAARRKAAELLGLSGELGTLEPGKRADVVVVDGDPFELSTLGDRIAAVAKDGRLVAGHV